MSTGPRLAAVLFTDLVGFTRLSASDETLAIRVVRIVHDCAKDAIEEAGGRVVKVLGDGVMAEFSSAEAAVRAALSLNLRSNRETGRLRGGPFHLRTGVHVGEIAVADDGDIYGSGVNIASRICGQAEHGTVVVSDDLYRVLKARREFTFSSLGDRTLKGLDEDIPVYQVQASPRLTTMILSDVPFDDEGDETDEAEAEGAPGGPPPAGRVTAIMRSVPTLPRQEAPPRAEPSTPAAPRATPVGASPAGPAKDELRFDDGSPTAGASGAGRGTQVLGSVPGIPGSPTPPERKAPAPPRGRDPGDRSAYTRVIMGGKDEGLAGPSTPSRAASHASTPSRRDPPVPSQRSVPTWLLGIAGAVAVALVVFIVLALLG